MTYDMHRALAGMIPDGKLVIKGKSGKVLRPTVTRITDPSACHQGPHPGKDRRHVEYMSPAATQRMGPSKAKK